MNFWSVRNVQKTGRLAQKVERSTREHNGLGLSRLWVRVPGWPTNKLLIVFRMRRLTEVPCNGAINRTR